MGTFRRMRAHVPTSLDLTVFPPTEDRPERMALVGHERHRGYRNPSSRVGDDPKHVQQWSDDPFSLIFGNRGPKSAWLQSLSLA